MTLTINGESRAVDDGAVTVGRLLDALRITHQAVAVLQGGAVVPREAYGSQLVQEGDVLEIVRFVGGG